MEISLSRIILFGLQIDQLKNWYINVFGFSVIEETRDEWVVLKAGAVEIALHKIGQAYIGNDTTTFRAESNTKLVFAINSDLHTFRQNLIAKGVTIQAIKSFDGINSLFVDGEDPEGNIFQIEQCLG